MNRRKLSLALAVLAILASYGAASAAAADSGLWLHVRVAEGGEGAKVVVNLPFSLIGMALPMLDVDEHIHSHRIHLDKHELTFAEMRDLWLEVRDGPDMAFVTVEEEDESVRVWKEKGYLYVRVRDRGDDRVDVKAPVEVIDALLGSSENGFDFEAAFQALAAQGAGDLVTVQDNDDSVRVWVDSNPEAGD